MGVGFLSMKRSSGWGMGRKALGHFRDRKLSPLKLLAKVTKPGNDSGFALGSAESREHSAPHRAAPVGRGSGKRWILGL